MPSFTMPKKVPLKRLVFVAVLSIAVLLAAAGQTLAQPAEPRAATVLIGKLKVGGYNLYVRHAATDWTQSDKIASHGDWRSCEPTRVRQLSQKGREDARELGAILRKLGVPLGQVFASPYCRTMETARLISGQEPQPTTDIMNLRSADFVGGREAVVARARARLSERPGAGANTLFVAHGNLGRAATNTSLSEGEVLVITPRGEGGFDIEGSLTLSVLRTIVGP